MELARYAATFWRWLWLIVLTTGLAAAISYWASSQLPQTFSATTTLMVGQVLENSNPQAEDFLTSQQLAQTYVLLVRRQPLLQATADALQLNISAQALASRVNAAVIPQTQLIQITVVDSIPQRANAIADELARQLILQSPSPADREKEDQRQFANQQLGLLQARINDANEQVKSLESRMVVETSARGVQDTQNQIGALQQKIVTWQGTYASLLGSKSGRTNKLTVVEPAVGSSLPISPNVPLNVLIAASIGFCLAFVAILLLEYLDDTIKTNDDVQRILRLPALGAIARISKIRTPADQLIAMRHPLSPVTEAYRVLRTNIQFSSLNSSMRPLLFTSAIPGEGATTVVGNLGISLAQAGKRVIVCDADLRRPSLDRLFGAPNQIGLTTLLLDESLPVEAALVGTPVPGLQILPSGLVPPNPAELLGSDQFKRRLKQLQEQAEIVLVDSPALLLVADATIVGLLCGGVVLVVDANRTRSELVRQGKATLDQIGLKVLGVVLNKATARRVAYHGPYTITVVGSPRGGIWRRIASSWAGLVNIHR